MSPKPSNMVQTTTKGPKSSTMFRNNFINRELDSQTSYSKQNSKVPPKIPSLCHAIPLNVLDELAARFLINIPMEDREDIVRVCFHLEQAHWFYIDFYVPSNTALIECSMKQFAAHMFRHIPFLQEYSEDVDQVIELWSEYKISVPVYGAIILNTNMDKVLMVQGFNKKSGWTFPKGKVNEHEEPDVCAAREVLEETGFDAEHLIHKEEYLEEVINKQTVRLYLVAGVSEENLFEPRVRGEIRNIQWWDLSSLPTRVGDKGTKDRLGLSPQMFYNVIPFIRKVQKWASLSVDEDIRNYNDLRMEQNFTSVELKEEPAEDRTVDHPKMVAGFCPPAWQNFRLQLDLANIESQIKKEMRSDFSKTVESSGQTERAVTPSHNGVPHSWQNFRLQLDLPNIESQIKKEMRYNCSKTVESSGQPKRGVTPSHNGVPHSWQNFRLQLDLANIESQIKKEMRSNCSKTVGSSGQTERGVTPSRNGVPHSWQNFKLDHLKAMKYPGHSSRG